jgi:transposase
MVMTHQDWATQRRTRALELYQKGWQQKTIAEALGVTKGAISQWVKIAKDLPKEQWKEALQTKKSTGRKPILAQGSPEAKALLAILEAGAEKSGFTGEFWTLRRLCLVAKRDIGVSVGTTVMYEFLQRSGYSCRKPQKIAKERNDAAVAGFKGGWRNLKKGL